MRRFLLNPLWKVIPCISIVDGKGPHIKTCRDHDNGTMKLYLHPPRQPIHTLPSEQGDQLCHAVIKPRLIKPMKASSYCTTYQMHAMEGSFQGIDTCDVVNFGDFSFCSVLLHQSEILSIKHRPDINSLLDHLERDGLISIGNVQGLRKEAMDYCYPDGLINKCLQGSTYIELLDAMQIQYEIGDDKCIKVKLEMNNFSICEEILTRRNWLQSIIHCQKLDVGRYGCRFPTIPKFSCKMTDTKGLWILCGM